MSRNVITNAIDFVVNFFSCLSCKTLIFLFFCTFVPFFAHLQSITRTAFFFYYRRNSPAVMICCRLLLEDATIAVYDPLAKEDFLLNAITVTLGQKPGEFILTTIKSYLKESGL